VVWAARNPRGYPLLGRNMSPSDGLKTGSGPEGEFSISAPAAALLIVAVIAGAAFCAARADNPANCRR
jgi:hypothetical protein